MKDRIVVIDTFSCGSFHEMFNAKILSAYSYIFKEVCHYGISSSIECIQKICVGHANIRYNRLPFSVIAFNNRFGVLFRFIWSAVYSAFLLLHLRKERCIAISYNNPFLLPLLRLLIPFLKSSVYVCCHGELELLSGLSGKSGFLAIVQKKILVHFFKYPIPENIHFLVLGNSIVENLRVIIPSNIMHFRSINHPYQFKVYRTIEQGSFPLKCRIGIIGLTNKNKGYDLLVRLTENVDLKSGDIELLHIGKIVGNLCFLQNKGVCVVERNEQGDLLRNVYEELVQSLQFVLFLYPTSSYKVTASGAIFEAISNLKPIIALSNPFFEYIFSIMGRIGYLFCSMDELERFMLTFHVEESDYLQMQNNMLNNRKYFSAKAVSGELNELMK